MKKILPLRTLEYNVPMPARSTRHVSADGELGPEQSSSLLNVKIDFQSGQLRFDGNWNYVISSNHQAEPHWYNLHRDRVYFNATVFPGQAIDLAEVTNGAAFAVEGMLSGSNSTAEYTGLLLLDPAKVNKTPGTICWNLSLYLYNSDSDDCELKLSWTFYPSAELSELN